MIKEIKIENFKSIESLNLELGRLNVFIGANGSGKSNILEGIAFGAAAMGDRVENLFLSARGVRTTEANLVRSAFLHNNKDVAFFFKIKENDTFKFSVRLEKNKWQLKPFINSESSSILMEHEFAKEMWLSEDGNLNFKDKKYKVGEKLPDDIITQWRDMMKHSSKRITEFLFDSYLSDYMIFAPENTYLRRFEDEAQIEPLGIKGEGLFKLLVKIAKNKPELFKKINENLELLEWFDGFEIPNDLMFTEKRIKIKDRYLEEGLQYFDQKSANEGFLYLLFYFTLFISDETPNFFAIDNIDNALNPKLGSQLIKILAKLAAEHGKQVILTTHNPAILDGLNLNDDMQRLFVISRNAEGHTKALRIQKEPIENGKPNVKLSEQFLRGYIGGLNF
jgi:predicted ATPase